MKTLVIHFILNVKHFPFYLNIVDSSSQMLDF